MRTSYTIQCPLDEDIYLLLHLVDTACGQCDIPYLAAGPIARDIVVHHVFGKLSPRQTRGTDLAILVASGESFESIRLALIKKGMKPTELVHRLELGSNSIGLDLIVFSPQTGLDDAGQWPSRHEVILSVSDFCEALETSMRVGVGPEISLRVASLRCLAVQKLALLTQRSGEAQKYAADFLKILTNYGQLHLDRITDAHISSKQSKWDQERRGAFLLGNDVSLILSAQTQLKMNRFKEEQEDLLIDTSTRLDPSLVGTRIKVLFEDFWSGIRHGIQKSKVY
jgi:predicted nucleotidyltransferase